MAELTRVQRLRTPLTGYALKLARESRIGDIWSSAEDVVTLLGGTRQGKSAALACYICDAPGAVVATSTRADLAIATMAYRASKGSSVQVFDPAGTSGMASSVKFSVLGGCTDPATARRRARDMIPAGPSGSERESWNALARRTFSVMLYAAALSDRGIYDVLDWAGAAGSRETWEEVEAALKTSKSETVRAWRGMAKQFFTTNSRTQSSITTSMVGALEWALDDTAAAAGGAIGDPTVFDIREFIATGQTLYIIGTKDDQVVPLMSALTGEIAYQARTMAKANGGRLDPPLALVLDEVTNTCPVDLPSWTSYMGGHNISMFIAAQDPSQLEETWGAAGAKSIQDTTVALLVFGGIKDVVALQGWSQLAGTRDVEVETKDENGKVTGTTIRSEPVVSPAQITSLPAHRAYLVRAGLSACIVDTPTVWTRRDVRQVAARNPYAPVVETTYAQQLDEEESEPIL
jgi:type IV secretory pathway TraG/TraD family ATPase VirD4